MLPTQNLTITKFLPVLSFEKSLMMISGFQRGVFINCSVTLDILNIRSITCFKMKVAVISLIFRTDRSESKRVDLDEIAHRGIVLSLFKIPPASYERNFSTIKMFKLIFFFNLMITTIFWVSGNLEQR